MGGGDLSKGQRSMENVVYCPWPWKESEGNDQTGIRTLFCRVAELNLHDRIRSMTILIRTVAGTFDWTEILGRTAWEQNSIPRRRWNLRHIRGLCGFQDPGSMIRYGAWLTVICDFTCFSPIQIDLLQFPPNTTKHLSRWIGNSKLPLSINNECVLNLVRNNVPFRCIPTSS